MEQGKDAPAEPGGPTAEAEFLRVVLDHANDVIAVLDADATIRYANDSARWLLELDPDDLKGSSALELVHPDDRDDAVGALSRSIEAGAGPLPRKVLRMRHGDGSWRWIEMASVNLLDDPTVRGIVVAVREVRERHEAEAQFRALLAHSSDIVSILDPDGIVRWSSAARTRLLGYPSGETEPDGDARLLVHPDDREAVTTAFLDVLQHQRGPDRPLIARVMALDGSWHYLEMMATNMLDDPNVRGVVVNSRDVTERIEAERARREEEDRFRLLVQHAYDAVVTFDLTGACVYASPATTRVLGYEPADLVGAQLIDQVHPEDLARTSTRVAGCIETPGSTTTVEYRSLHADGSWRRLETVFTNLLDEPAVGAIVANLHDVTELRTAQAELERQATHDPLTDLPNRQRLRAVARVMLQRAADQGGTVTLLYVDLDGFKPVNDGLGHHRGDLVLETVARRLRHGSRPGDVVARVGGDEFCVLCEADLTEAMALAERLRAKVTQPIDLAGTTLSVDASIGVAVASEGDTLESLMQMADSALRRAKQSGKSRVELFHPAGIR